MDFGVDVSCAVRYRVPDILPQLLRAVQSDLNLYEIGSKSDVSTDIFRSHFNESISVFDGYSRIYTDGTKDDAAAAGAAVTESVVSVKRLSDHSSIFCFKNRTGTVFATRSVDWK
jgi:hypothetical protein